VGSKGSPATSAAARGGVQHHRTRGGAGGELGRAREPRLQPEQALEDQARTAALEPRERRGPVHRFDGLRERRELELRTHGLVERVTQQRALGLERRLREPAHERLAEALAQRIDGQQPGVGLRGLDAEARREQRRALLRRAHAPRELDLRARPWTSARRRSNSQGWLKNSARIAPSRPRDRGTARNAAVRPGRGAARAADGPRTATVAPTRAPASDAEVRSPGSSSRRGIRNRRSRTGREARDVRATRRAPARRPSGA
jgi:hypothetical protein